MTPFFHVVYTKFWPYYLNIATEIEILQTRQFLPGVFLSRCTHTNKVVGVCVYIQLQWYMLILHMA